MESTEFPAATGSAIDSRADDGIARLQSRARNAGYAIFAFVAISAVFMVFELLELGGIVDLESVTPGPIEAIYGIVAILYTVIFIASVVLIAMWIYRAHANLKERGIETESSPGWAVGWFFIPIANLFKPFQYMRELWNESHLEYDSYGEPAPSEITAWWACWILGNILANVSLRMTSFGDGSNVTVGLVLSLASGGLLIGSALVLRGIITAITRAQDGQLDASRVFD